MAKKSYCVSIYLDVFNVSCPGVWLCPKGKVYLKVSLFGVSDTTKKVEPTYPLVFNERFVFQKAFTGVASFEQLGGVLEKKELLLDLVQVANGPKRVVRLSRQQEKVTLSSFRSPICQLVYPTLFDPPGGPVRQRVTSTASEIDLLLSPSSKYPGILAPKVTVSARCSVEELKDFNCQEDLPKPSLNLPTSRLTYRKPHGVIRQKRVCHSKRYQRCGCYSEPKKKQRFQRETFDLDLGSGILAPVVQSGKLRKCISSSPLRPDTTSYDEGPGTKDNERSESVGEKKCCSRDERPRQKVKSAKCTCAICMKYDSIFHSDDNAHSLAVAKSNSATINASMGRGRERTSGAAKLSSGEEEDYGVPLGGCRCGKRTAVGSNNSAKSAVGRRPQADKRAVGCGTLCGHAKTPLRDEEKKVDRKELPPCVCVRKEPLAESPPGRSQSGRCRHCSPPSLGSPKLSPRGRHSSPSERRQSDSPSSEPSSQLEPPQHHLLPQFHAPIVPAPRYNRSPSSPQRNKPSVADRCCSPMSPEGLDIEEMAHSGRGFDRPPHRHTTRSGNVSAPTKNEVQKVKSECKCKFIENLPSPCCSRMEMVRRCETFRHLYYENLEGYYRYLLEKTKRSDQTPPPGHGPPEEGGRPRRATRADDDEDTHRRYHGRRNRRDSAGKERAC